MNNTMNLTAASHCLFDMICKIAQHFDLLKPEMVQIDYQEVVFTVTLLPPNNYTDADFHRFCKENGLTGVIYFNGGHAAPTFSMAAQRS